MRTCGECIACCVYCKIECPELSKKAMTPCPHLTLPGPPLEDAVYYTGASEAGNCGIYEDRPEMCRAYDCAWLQGYGDDGDRPDKALMLFDRSHAIDNALEAKPLAPGHEDTPEGRAVIDRMSVSTRLPVVVLNFYERKIQRIAGWPVPMIKVVK